LRGWFRTVRKHRTALIALAVYNFVLFFPVAFMGRVISPNDVFSNFSPWAAVRPADFSVQNPLINDPPTAYFTLMSLARSEPRAFHWNPYIGSGIPGWGSSASAILSPFIFLPLFLVPLAWVYTAIVFLKLNVAYTFAYFWLREERLGRRGAAIGALVIAGAGVYAVRWLWQITNATALYPALLWILRRALRGKRVSIAATALIALAYALAGFPAAMAYGAYLAVIYAVYLLVRARGLKPAAPQISRGLAAMVIAVLIALPSLVPFVQFLRRSGYLEARKTISLEASYPATHLASFVLPDRLGHPVQKNWTGNPKLGVLNNYVEATVYVGILTIPLALLGLLNRRARARWFWLGATVLIVAIMFGAPVIGPLVAKLPGFKYSALARAGLLLPIALGYLAAAARLPRRAWIGYDLIALVLAFDLALVAGRFHPYLPPKEALVPSTPTIDALRRDRPPFRIAPQFDYLWPNAAELVRVEDVRAHFGSEGDYRRLLQRLDPTSWSGQSTVITFNSVKYDFDDPLAGMLGIRWYIEHKSIDILKWHTFGATIPGVKEIGTIPIKPGAVLQRTVRVEAEPFWAIEVPVHLESEKTPSSRLELTLLKGRSAVWTRMFTRAETNVMNKVYVPLRAFARAGEEVMLRMRSHGVTGWTLEGENRNAAESPMFYGRVMTPVVFDRELPDGRHFRNLAELPRFWPVSKLRKLNDDEFLTAKDVDYAIEAVITDDPVMPPDVSATDARVRLESYRPDEQRVRTEASQPFFLVSSEKLTPELAVTMDGRSVRPIETNMLFAGVHVPAGSHEIVFARRIGRGWWWAAGLGVLLWVAAAAHELIAARRRG
jgi:hypothetical protein